MTTITRPTVRRYAMAALLAGSSSVAAACGVSPAQEAQIGAEYSAEVNRQLPIVYDAEISRYLNRLGTSIARHADRNFNYRFYLVNTKEVNAFALPGGYVYINRGIVERADNLSEFAGVLAHEIAHVDLRHGAEQMERMQAANVGLSLAYILTGRQPGGLERGAVSAAGSVVFAKYGRQAENEADSEAIELLVEAGIHPRGLTTFFQELIEERKRRPSQLEQWFSTHPLTEERIESTRAQIARLPASQLRGLSTNSQEFQRFKSRVQRLPAPPRSGTTRR